MSYNIVNADGTPLATVADGQINTTTTSLTLIGKNYAGYGTFLNENFLYLLQNFSSATAPQYPTVGQLWWKSDTRLLQIYDKYGNWKSISGAQSLPTSPSNPVAGDLWFDTVNQQLKTYSGAAWITIGPSFSATTGTSGAIADTIVDTSLVSHVVVKFYVQNNLIAILNKDATFTPSTPISGFSVVQPGFNLASNRVPALVYYDNANNASYLGGNPASSYVTSTTPTLTGQLVVQNLSGLQITDTSNNQYLTIGAANSNINFVGLYQAYGMTFKTKPATSNGSTIDAISIDKTTGLVSVQYDTPTTATSTTVATKGYVDTANAYALSQIALQGTNQAGTTNVLTANTTVVYGNVRQIQADLGYNVAAGVPASSGISVGVNASTAYQQFTSTNGTTFAGNLLTLWANLSAFYSNVLNNSGIAGGAAGASMYANILALQSTVQSQGGAGMTRSGGPTSSIQGIFQPDQPALRDLGTQAFRFNNFYTTTANVYGSINTTNTSTPNGTLYVTGGAGITQSLQVGGNIVANSGIASSNTTTGAIVVSGTGGVGVGGALNVGTTATVGTGLTVTSGGATVSAGGLTVTAGGASVNAGGLTVTGGATLNGVTNATGNLVASSATVSVSSTTGALVVAGGGGAGIGGILQVGGNIVAGSGTTSTNTTSGALIVVGGAGVSGALNVGSSATVGGGLTVTASGINVTGGNIVAGSGTAAVSASSGALVVAGTGGAGIGGILQVGGNIVAASSQASSSTTTGALVVMGGTGIGGALNVGTGLTVNSGGATVTAGGITVTNGGITVNGGDVTLNNTSGLTVQGTTTFNGNVRVAGAFSEFIAQNLIVTGSLFVQGNTTTVNATSVSTQDLLYVAASAAVTPGTAVGGGIATPYSALTFSNAPSNAWVSNVSIRPSANASVSLGDYANDYYWKQVAAETGYFGALSVNGSAVLTNASLAGQGVTSVAGTTNQIAVSGSYTVASGGAVTLSLPQSINSGATPTFTGTNFTGIPNGGLVNSSVTVAAGTGVSVSPTGGVVALGGTVTVTNSGVVSLTADATNGLTASASTGAVTLTLAQSISTTAAPTFKGTNFTVIPNGALSNSGITHSAGTGLTVSPTTGQVALGGTVTYTNDGVLSVAAGTGMTVSGTGTGPFKGAVTVTNAGVTGLTGDSTNGLTASASTGAVTLSLAQSIATTAAPTFKGTNFTIIPNSALSNSSVIVAAGTGISVSPVGGSVALGGTVTVTNSGVVSLTGDATNGLTVSASTGAVTLSLPQALTTTSAPTFKGTNFTIIPNGALSNSSVTVAAGTGITVSPTGGVVALGGTVTVTNNGVTNISINGAANVKGDVAITIPTKLSNLTNDLTMVSTVAVVMGSPAAAAAASGAVSITVPNNTNQLTNGANFITSAGAPVQSVGGYTGTVTNAQVAAAAQAGASGTWPISISGNANTANYADLAEKYLPDADYAPGTVVIFGGEQEITQSTMANDRRVAGVISTMPAWGMNEKLVGGIFVALTGRVPTKVIGTIEKGDLIVSSDTPGVAMANNDPKMGTIIGKALEAYNSGEVGEIEVVIGRF